MKPWYQILFDNYAENYEKELFTSGKSGECDFLESEFPKPARVLDIGCGTGRHSINLAKRGYRMVGIDISEKMLQRARANAEKLNADVNFLHGDARNLSYVESFNHAIMICEGGFSLMESDEMNFQILSNAYRAIKQQGKFIFTCLNALYPLVHSTNSMDEKNLQEGLDYKEVSFDLMTFRETSQIEVSGDDGSVFKLKANERYYSPSEITWILKSIGFTKSSIYAAELGCFSRSQELRSSDYEMLVIAEK